MLDTPELIRGDGEEPPVTGRRAGVGYRGQAYQGWQSQPGGRTVQDRLEAALAQFADRPIRTLCAGRTDAGVHAINQVVHFDTDVVREPFSWVRGTNRYLPDDIAVQWCLPVAGHFHARNSARGRRYRYVVLESAVRPALESGLVGLGVPAARRATRCAQAAAHAARRARLQLVPRRPNARRRRR